MSITQTTCFVVACDDCLISPDDGYGVPHLPTREEAIAYATADEDFTVDPNGSVLCTRCAVIATCRVEGHQWVTWGDLRYCGRCDSSGMNHTANITDSPVIEHTAGSDR